MTQKRITKIEKLHFIGIGSKWKKMLPSQILLDYTKLNYISLDKIVFKDIFVPHCKQLELRILKSLHSGTKTYTQNVINQLSCGGVLKQPQVGFP